MLWSSLRDWSSVMHEVMYGDTVSEEEALIETIETSLYGQLVAAN